MSSLPTSSSVRPFTTLFILQSIDGKITPGDTDQIDFDRDFPTIKGVGKGLEQVYEIEKNMPQIFLTTGKTLAKLGVNFLSFKPKRAPTRYAIIDSKPHLTKSGLLYMATWAESVCVYTTNPHHPAFTLAQKHPSLHVHLMPLATASTHKMSMADVLTSLQSQHAIHELTIQAGGTLNASLVREGLVDKMTLVVAPCLVGGANTPTLVDGESLHTSQDLHIIQSFILISCTQLEDSYIKLEFALKR